MSKNKFLFIGLVLIVFVVIWLVYVYYYSYQSTNKTQLPVVIHPSVEPKIETEKSSTSSNVVTYQPVTKTASSMPEKITEKDYQPSEGEKRLYAGIIRIISPKEPCAWLQDHDSVEKNKEWLKIWFDQPVYKRNPQANLQEMIIFFQELIKQYPNSPYYQHYQETLKLIRQMQEEDEEFNKKYCLIGHRAHPSFHHIPPEYDEHLPSLDFLDPLDLDEEISCYIYYLRHSYFYKIKQYKMAFIYDKQPKETGCDTETPWFAGGELVRSINNLAAKTLLNFLEDRRPIIADDDTDIIPAKFYRYQDAAVEILEYMFMPNKKGSYNPPFVVKRVAKRKLPLELSDDEYFSEYFAKQTPEGKQKILDDIKTWVEESMNNLSKSDEQSPK